MKVTPHDEGTQLPPELDLDLVALARSGPGPYRIEAELPAAWMARVLAHTDAELTRPGRVAFEVTSIGEGTSYLIRGAIDGAYSVPCARCLAPAEVSAGSEVCVHYVRDRGDRSEDDEAEADSPDVRTFSGTRIDLRPLLAEQILVSYPMRALCGHGEACRGLCMHCGADLNQQTKKDGPCEVCGATDAQVPIAAEADLDASPPSEAPWQAALRELASSGSQAPGKRRGKKR